MAHREIRPGRMQAALAISKRQSRPRASSVVLALAATAAALALLIRFIAELASRAPAGI
jgi:hypothetical protein